MVKKENCKAMKSYQASWLFLFVCFNCVAYFVFLLKSFVQALTDIHIYHFYGFLFVCLSMVNLFLFSLVCYELELSCIFHRSEFYVIIDICINTST